MQRESHPLESLLSHLCRELQMHITDRAASNDRVLTGRPAAMYGWLFQTQFRLNAHRVLFEKRRLLNYFTSLHL